MSSPFLFDVGDEIETPDGKVGMIVSRTEELFGNISYKGLFEGLEFVVLREAQMPLKITNKTA